MAKLLKFIITIIVVTSTPLIQAQNLYYSDGSPFPLSISKSCITVKFLKSVSVLQQSNYSQSLSQIDPGKDKRGLPNNFIGIPLKSNVNVSQFIQTLKRSNLFEAIFPVYYTQEQEEIIIYDEFLVRFKPTVLAQDIENFASRHGVETVKTNKIRTSQYTFRWTPAADGNTLVMADMFFDSLACEWATPDFIIPGSFFDIIPNDPYFPNQYYLHNTGQVPIPGEGAGVSDTDIDAPGAWDISLGSSNITVAVIDAGVRPHPDLPASRILPGYDFAGYNQYTSSLPISPPDNDPSPDGNEAHGMAVAGVIAASHNSIGIAGIAPNCKILPIKISDFRGYFPEISKVAEAVDFAWQNGADIINGSWGYPTSDPNNPLYYAIRDAINDAITYGRNGLGTVCVFAAGNFKNRNNSYVAFPANVPGVVAVGAIDKSGNIQSYSPQDTDIDIVAPSGAISTQLFQDRILKGNVWSIEIDGEIGFNPGNYNTSGLPEDQLWIDYSNTSSPKGDNYPPGDYTARFGGTSAAAPQVSGVAALILSQNPDRTQSNVVAIIKNTAVDIGLPVEDQGSGLLNACNALNGPPETPQNFQVTRHTSVYPYRPKLTWSANTEPDLAGYRIERKINNGSWAPPNLGGDNVPPDETEFIDMEILIWRNSSSNNQTAYYRLKAFDLGGLYSEATQIEWIDFRMMFDIGNDSTALSKLTPTEPNKIELFQNYPNPFNPTTKIKFALPETGNVKITIYNIQGKVISGLANREYPAGYHEVSFNASKLSSGFYFYKIEVNGFVSVKKMQVIK